MKNLFPHAKETRNINYKNYYFPLKLLARKTLIV